MNIQASSIKLTTSIAAAVPRESERGLLGAIAVVIVLDENTSFLELGCQKVDIVARPREETYGAIFAESTLLAGFGWVATEEILVTNGFVGESSTG